MTKKVLKNRLTMAHRVHLIDWLRANASRLPDLYTHEIVEEAAKAINHSCSAHQLRETAKAANVSWATKKYMPKGTSGQKGRMDGLEARIAELEAWCTTAADGLGLQPPNGTPLPDDDDL